MYNWVQTWGKIKISEVLRATYLATYYAHGRSFFYDFFTSTAPCDQIFALRPPIFL